MWSRRINYLTLIILVLVGLIFYHEYYMMLITVIVVFMPVISYIMIKKGHEKLEFHVDSDMKNIGKDIESQVYFSVKNDSYIPIENVHLKVKILNSFYGNEEEYEIIMSAIPKKTRKTQLSVSGIYCGNISVKIEKVIFYDLFGMIKIERELDESCEIHILPSKIYKFDEIGLSESGSSSEDEIQSKKGDDPSQISEIRNYIPGDKLKNIHWKLSAKSDELQVKEFSMPYSEEVLLLVETYVEKDAPESFDEEIEVLYAFSIHLLNMGRKFKMVWKNGEYNLTEKEIYNTDDLNDALNDLYYCQVQAYNGLTYELYKSLNPEIKGIVLYLSNKNVANINAEQLNIEAKGVMIGCLN